METVRNILIITPFFSPNIGGVETHLSDLINQLNKNNYSTTVLTYSPITTPSISYNKIETIDKTKIIRFPWFGKSIFHQIEKLPFFDFLYLTPYLGIRCFFWMLFNYRQVNVIHSQGFNAAFIGYFLSIIFRKKHLISIHAIYDHLGLISQNLIKPIINNSHKTLCLSKASKKQLLSWDINSQKLTVFHYWIDLKFFKPAITKPKKLTFIFVGRLIIKKGILIYLKLAAKFPQYNFLIVGSGPEINLVNQYLKKYSNIIYLGTSPLYQQASVLITPSLYQEGYGRVVMEATACGLPVIASNLGGLPEALDNSVAILVKPNLKNFIKAIKTISKPKIYQQLSSNCRQYALKNFSSKNFFDIQNTY